MEDIDKLSKYADLIYKKMLVLLAVCAGSGSYGVKFFLMNSTVYGISLFFIFIFVAYGVFINYIKLRKVEMLIEEVLNV